MCVVCKDWQAGKLSNQEAIRNLGELINTEIETDEQAAQLEHYINVFDKVMDKEVPFSDSDEELDQKWHEENHE